MGGGVLGGEEVGTTGPGNVTIPGLALLGHTDNRFCMIAGCGYSASTSKEISLFLEKYIKYININLVI